ncbi:putative PEP-binding protein [Saccharothrix isguenensis]
MCDLLPVPPGVPVPPGFIIPAGAYRQDGAGHPGLGAQLTALERESGRTLGQDDSPLLVSVRLEVRCPEPISAEPVVNIGLADHTVDGFASWSGSQWPAWYAYQQLLVTFGVGVLGIDRALFDHEIEALKSRRGVPDESGLALADLMDLVETFKRVTRVASGQDFPQDPVVQLSMAVRAFFESCGVLPDDDSEDDTVAVIVHEAVFGDLDAGSCTGFAFTRDPDTGQPGVVGRYVLKGGGDKLAAGVSAVAPLSGLDLVRSGLHGELAAVGRLLEERFRDLCEIEFVVQCGELWVLRVRPAKRAPAAAFQIVDALYEENLIDADEVLRRTTGDQLAQLMSSGFKDDVHGRLVTTAVAVSPGVAVGHVVLDSVTATQWIKDGKPVILVRQDTDPGDMEAMMRSEGVLTTHGGQASHAAVVARSFGVTCVCGAADLVIDVEARRLRAQSGVVLNEGDLVSIDGGTGAVYAGAMPIVPSAVRAYFEGGVDAEDVGGDNLVRSVHRIMEMADSRRSLRVLANVDAPSEAARARHLGAEGIGLCRTEHMFLGERAELLRRVLLAGKDGYRERSEVLAELLRLQRADFVRLFETMDGRAVTVRLLDPPLHEFLPDRTELSVRVAVAEVRGEAEEYDRRLLRAVQRLHERNPMLGSRGVRLGLGTPEVYATQVRAIAEAVASRLSAGGNPDVRIMIPFVGSVEELALVRERAEAVMDEVADETGTIVPKVVGTMIEVPRSALVAGELAGCADFFSFGTNDLTQATWAMSRDDAEASYLADYRSIGLLTDSPFETIDRAGVGRLIEIAVREGRYAKADLEFGVCGEHGGDPSSIHFFHEVGMHYVSCPPLRIPVARLEAARAVVLMGNREEIRTAVSKHHSVGACCTRQKL